MRYFPLLLLLCTIAGCRPPLAVPPGGPTPDRAPGLSWSSDRDLTEAQFSHHYTRYRMQGLIPRDLDAYPDGRGGLHYAMIGEKNPDGRGWGIWRNLTDAEYQSRWATYRDRGYRPAVVEGYTTANGIRYAGLWVENRENLEWSSERNLTGEDYDRRVTERRNAGFRPVDVTAYTDADGPRYAVVWHANPEMLGWAQHRAMSPAVYRERADAFAARGYWMIDLEAYRAGNEQRYAALWVEDRAGAATVARTDRSELEFANDWRTYRDRGLRPLNFERYATTNGPRYAGIWVENDTRYRWGHRAAADSLVSRYRTEHDLPAVSVAIMEEGRVVYQRGFGMADVAAGRVAHGESVYLLASISKVIGGTLATKLEAEGRLADGTPVSLDLDRPTRSYIDLPAAGHTHTVAQLTAHLGCVPHYANSTTPTGYFATAAAAAEVLAADPILADCTVGTTKHYSTHAFTYLGAVLETVTGRPIARLVEEEISERYGLPSIRAMYRYPELRPNYERVRPYALGSEIAYEENSWKILGGGIEASAVDLVRFGRLIETGTLVTPGVRDGRLWQRLAPATNSNHGITWDLPTVNGLPVAEHGGSANGSRTHLRVYRIPGRSLIICVLTNSRTPDHSPVRLVDSLGDLLLAD